MKNIVLFCLIFVLVGCTYKGEKISTYVDDPKTIFQDPLSVKHQKALDELERKYLRKDITYAEYIESKKKMEEDYVKEVQAREAIIEGK